MLFACGILTRMTLLLGRGRVIALVLITVLVTFLAPSLAMPAEAVAPLAVSQGIASQDGSAAAIWN